MSTITSRWGNTRTRIIVLQGTVIDYLLNTRLIRGKHYINRHIETGLCVEYLLILTTKITANCEEIHYRVKYLNRVFTLYRYINHTLMIQIY